jgi:hypothetical protein
MSGRERSVQRGLMGRLPRPIILKSLNIKTLSAPNVEKALNFVFVKVDADWKGCPAAHINGRAECGLIGQELPT